MLDSVASPGYSSSPRFGNQSGIMAIGIADTGIVTSKFENTTLGAAGRINGTVDEDGEFECTAEFSNQVYTLKGLIVKTKAGQLKGTLTQYSGSRQAVGVVEFDLPPKK